MAKLKSILPAILLFIFLSSTGEVLVRFQFIPESLLPAPSQVLNVLIDLHSDFLSATLTTLRNTCLGLLLSILCGGGLAFVFSLSKTLRKAILPFAIFFQTVPIIAIAPLLVIYFGFGAPTVVASSFIVSVFPIIANTLSGLESPTSGQRDLFKLYQATNWQTLVHLKLPNAYVAILSGLKTAMGLSIIGSVAGEFVAGGGLGAMIDTARTQQRVDIVFAALFLLSLLGILFIGMLQFIHALIIQRRPLSPGDF